MSGHLKELLAGEAACPGDPLRNVLPQRFWMLGRRLPWGGASGDRILLEENPLCLKDHDDHVELCETEVGVQSDRIAPPLD